MVAAARWTASAAERRAPHAPKQDPYFPGYCDTCRLPAHLHPHGGT